MTEQIFFFADWQVSPKSNRLSRGAISRQLEPKAMEVLLYLCSRAGEVVSSEELLQACWQGQETGDNPLHKTIALLRRALDDSATTPQFIETIRRRGYRTLAEVSFPVGHEAKAKPQVWQSGSPFVGLRAFNAADAGVFFGRRQQINAVLEQLDSQVRTGRGFCLLLGPSGSGKTSLIHAGVLPNLMTPQGVHGIGVVSATSLDMADVAKGQLYLALAASLLDWELDDKPVYEGHSCESLAASLQSAPQSLSDHLLRLLPRGIWDKPRFALVLDRLEVLLSSPLFDDASREAFLGLIDLLSRSGAVLVLCACRNDFYPLVVSQATLMAGKGNGAHFDLEPPNRQALLQMIRLPAAAAGLEWEFDSQSALGLDELLCRDVAASPDVLPMLQYLLQVLYLERDDNNRLRLEVYHRLGGIEGAIGRAADDALSRLNPEQAAALPRVLARLVTLAEDEHAITSRSARYSELASDAERQLVQALVDSRLFVSHLEDAEPSFSVAHEALLRRWRRASSWIEDHRHQLALKSRLFHQARRWHGAGRERDYLLGPGKPVQEARQLLEGQVELDERSRDFIHASLSRAARRKQLKRGTAALLAVLTLVSVLMGLNSMRAERLANERRLVAEDLLGFMVGQFADRLRSIGRMDLLDGVSNKALDYFSAKDSSLTAPALLRHGQTLEAMGEVAYSREKTAEAMAALLAARSKLLPLVGSAVPQLELYKTLGANAFWLGQIEYDKRDWAAAKPWLGAYLEHSEAMVRLAPSSRDAILELSYAENSLGSLAMKQQDYGRAAELFEASLQRKQQLLAASPGDGQLLADVADSQSWLASAALAKGEVKKALALYQETGAVLGASTEAYALDRLSHSQVKLARLYQWLGDTEAARQALEHARQSRSAALSGDPDNLSWRYDLLTVKILGLELGVAAATATALAGFEATLMQDMAGLPPERQQKLTQLYYGAAAKRWFDLGDFAKAEAAAAGVIATFEPNSKAANAEVNNSTKLADAQLLWLASRRAQGMDQAGNGICLEVKEVLMPLAGASSEPRIIRPLVLALECLGELEAADRLKAPLLAQGVRFDSVY